MPVTLTPAKLNPLFTDEWTGSGGGGVDYLLGSILDKLTCELQFDIWWNSLDIPVVFDSATKTITRTDIAIFTFPTTPSTKGNYSSFVSDEFKPGDIISVVGSLHNDATFTIATVTDKVITVLEALTTETVASVNIYGDTPITAVDYYFNLIENDSAESYKSLIDYQNSCKYNVNGISIGMGAAKNMIPIGNSLGWTSGGEVPTIDDVGLVNHVQTYKILHELFITPAFLSKWFSNIKYGSNPKGFYLDTQSLKYIAKIDAKYTNIEVTPSHTSNWFSSFKKGNVGFYDEFLNGFPANYELKSITFTDVLTSLPINNLQYGRSTDVEIHLKSVSGVFASGCKVNLQQAYCPLNESDYTNTGKNTQAQNFWGDKNILTEGAAPANGVSYGTDTQNITAAQAILISPAELKIIYRCSLSAVYSAFIEGKDSQNRNYLLVATPQNKAVTTTAGTDRNAVICSFDNYTTDKTNSALFRVYGGDIFFHEYPDEVTNDKTDAKLFSNDYCFVNGNLEVESLSDVILQSLTFKIEAVKIYETNVVLEQHDFNISVFAPDKDLIQQIDIEEFTNFKVSSNSIYDNYTLKRNSALDSGNYIVYAFGYPFKVRYETWIALMSEAFPNGTRDWAAYQAAGWAIQFNIYATVYDVVNDWTDNFLHTSNLSFNAFDSLRTVSCQVKTFDETGVQDLDNMILPNENTLVVATFKGDFSSLPAGKTGYYGFITLDSPEIGGINYAQEVTTESTPLTNGIWLSKAVLTVVDTQTITVGAIIDYTKIGDLSAGKYPLKYLTFFAKIGYKQDLNNILCEDSALLLCENGDGLIQE